MPAQDDISSVPEHQRHAARERIEKFSNEGNLPAFGHTVASVVQLASSDDESVQRLAQFILSDVALTQKVLRMSNAAIYRTSFSTPVTTVTKAILLLGFQAVKTHALAMFMLSNLASSQHAQSVQTELAYSLCASAFGREIGQSNAQGDVEEIAIAALFKNLGRLLTATHDYKLYNEILLLIEQGHSPEDAAIAKLGCCFDALGESALQSWKMPDALVRALMPLASSGPLKEAVSKMEWVRQSVAFGADAANVMVQAAGDLTRVQEAMDGLLERYGKAFNLRTGRLNDMFENVGKQVSSVTEDLYLMAPVAIPVNASIDQDMMALPQELQMSTLSVDLLSGNNARHPSGKPMNARDILLAGVQDVTQMMGSGRCNINDLIMLILETLYQGLGFRFAAMCLKDLQRQQFRARFAMGEDYKARQASFFFPLETSRNIFHLSLQNNADLMISDSRSANIQPLLPTWYRSLLPDARSFVILPLVVEQKVVGLFYADRTNAAPEGVPPDEAALIKTLKGQILAALQP